MNSEIITQQAQKYVDIVQQYSKDLTSAQVFKQLNKDTYKLREDGSSIAYAAILTSNKTLAASPIKKQKELYEAFQPDDTMSFVNLFVDVDGKDIVVTAKYKVKGEPGTVFFESRVGCK